MIQKLHDIQVSAGALFEESSTGVTVPISFGNDAWALNAARTGVAVADRSHWGRIMVGDSDRVHYLHNQSTNDFQQLQPGQGCDTVFVTSTARTIDLVTAYAMEDAVLLLVSPHRRQQLMKWLDRFIFFADKVKLTDITDETATFSLIGPGSDALLEKLAVGEIVGKTYASHILVPTPPKNLQGKGESDSPLLLGDGLGESSLVAVGSGLAMPGYTLIVPADAAATQWKLLLETGAVPLGERCWEQLRIEQGRPTPDRELTEDYNPLEARLWQTISFSKGCYIGQETIARLNTYQGVKQQLWGVRLIAPAQPGTPVMVGEEKVGKLTSYTETEQGGFGLAYIRTKAGGEGLKVKVGDVDGEIVDVPFLTHGSSIEP